MVYPVNTRWGHTDIENCTTWFLSWQNLRGCSIIKEGDWTWNLHNSSSLVWLRILFRYLPRSQDMAYYKLTIDVWMKEPGSNPLKAVSPKDTVQHMFSPIGEISARSSLALRKHLAYKGNQEAWYTWSALGDPGRRVPDIIGEHWPWGTEDLQIVSLS